MVNLLKYLFDPSGNKIPLGVAYRSHGKVVFTGAANFLPNYHSCRTMTSLSKIDVTGRSKPLDIYSYIGNPHAGRIASFLNNNGPISYFPLLTSYGCGFNCRFCDTDKNLIR